MISGFTFQYPYAFLLIILYFVCQYFCKENKQSLYFSNIAMLKVATKNQHYVITILKFLIFFFMVIALASPVKKDEIQIDSSKGYEISLVLDASGSMKEYNKFDITKEILADFIAQRETDRLALSIFADFAYVAVPLTYDKKSLTNLLELLNVGVAGQRQTALYEALYLSSNLFKESSSKNKIAILLTDGVDNTETIPLDVAINRAKKYGIKVYTIGIGGIGDYNPTILNEIANQTDGKFFEARSKEEIAAIYKEIDTLEKSEIKTDKFVKIEYFYQYPLDVAIGLLFMFMIYTRRQG
jgi:Ca-activated chloride channel family protein